MPRGRLGETPRGKMCREGVGISVAVFFQRGMGGLLEQQFINFLPKFRDVSKGLLELP